MTEPQSRRTFIGYTAVAAVVTATASAVTGLTNLLFPARAEAREGKDILQALIDAKCTDQDGKPFTGEQVKGRMFLQGAGFQFCEFCTNTLAPAQSRILTKLPADTKFVIINTRSDTKPDAYLKKLKDAGINTDNVVILTPPGEKGKMEENARTLETKIGDVPGVEKVKGDGTHTFILNLVGKDGKSKFARGCNVKGEDLEKLTTEFSKAAGGISR